MSERGGELWMGERESGKSQREQVCEKREEEGWE